MIWPMLIGALGASVVCIVGMLLMSGLGRLHRDNVALNADNERLRGLLKQTGQPVLVQFTEQQLMHLANGLRTQIITLHESEHGPKN